ncbi:MAG: alpha/beta fold hydrolase, partial [Paracoccaceae bacterium]
YTIPQEAQDAVTLMDHLGIDKAAILGTSRGGLIAMGLAAGARDRLLGVALNDIGPDIAPTGMEVIKTYIGRPPPWRTLAEAAAARPTVMAGFANVPASRWATEVAHFYTETPDGLTLSYDPGLRTAVLATTEQPLPDLWPFFEAIGDLPVCALRGANSDLLSAACFAEMQRRLPHMIATTIPDRGHVPFLDEPDALTALNRWLDQLA